MVPLKRFLSIVLQLIIIEEFINSKALGRNVVDTAFCPISRQPGGSTWLLHGMPPKCYVAGLQGPCDFNQVFLPKSQNSNHGQCMPLSHANIHKLNSGDKVHYISQKLASYDFNRIKRQTDLVYVQPEEPSVPGFISKDILCSNGTFWSISRGQCM
ncbi:unnamed protein product [Orchesella dallaii]|uniref:Uncharacterized protein n=1 Tax=Orchesella dallaii TaxID=48710 RepID=A0ABP1PM59_9HEXA